MPVSSNISRLPIIAQSLALRHGNCSIEFLWSISLPNYTELKWFLRVPSLWKCLSTEENKQFTVYSSALSLLQIACHWFREAVCSPVWQVRRPSKLSSPVAWKILYLHKTLALYRIFCDQTLSKVLWGDPASIVWTIPPTSACFPACLQGEGRLLPSQRAQPSCRAPRRDRNVGIGGKQEFMDTSLSSKCYTFMGSSQEIRLRVSHYLQRRSCLCLPCEWRRTHHPGYKHRSFGC